MTDSSALRMVWAPRGGAAEAEGWWPANARTTSPLSAATGDLLHFGSGVDVSERDGVIEATWRDSRWQPALGEPTLTATVTPQDLRITVPAVWRSHAYLGWRDGRLLVSSDLRTLAAAMPAARPSPEGIAAFLAGCPVSSGIAPSLYRNIWALQPGHALTIGATRGKALR